jgi:hypothetical protein
MCIINTKLLLYDIVYLKYYIFLAQNIRDLRYTLYQEYILDSTVYIL